MSTQKLQRFGGMMTSWGFWSTPFLIRPLGREFPSLTIYSGWMDLKLPRGYLVLQWKYPWRLYASPDATPPAAWWLIGRGTRWWRIRRRWGAVARADYQP